MTSEVEICNLALSHIRAGSINSLDESSIQAQQCKLNYPFARDQILEDAQWNFAHALKPLALLTDEVFNWVYVYQYPSDCQHVNHLVRNFATVNSGATSAVASRFDDNNLPRPNHNPPVEYDIYNIDGNRVIVANEAELRIDYRVKVTNPNLFSNKFVLALSHLLASMLAIPLVGVDKGRPLMSDQLSIYSGQIRSAIANNMNQKEFILPDSELINIRS